MEDIDYKLQEAFGKVVYSIAKIDGEVQQIEVDVFHKLIANHEWAQAISLSFEVERELDMDANKVFLRAMKVFRFNGHSEHYPFFIDLLEKIAEAHDGVIFVERQMIDRFKEILLEL